MTRDPYDDANLLRDFRQSGSDVAFTELVRRHLPLVFQVALRRLGSAALAEEAAQNAFTRLAAKVAAVSRHPERLRAWLHRTAYFEASTLARKEHRQSRVPVNPDPEPMKRPEIYDRLDEALDKLPELDRELVLRHCCGGEDYRRMAEAVGKSEAACQKRVERALGRLAQGLGGARTTTAVVATLAVSSVKLPAAEMIAAAALRQHLAASGLGGAVSGAKAAACAALVLAGGVAGWQSAPTPPSVAPVVVAASPTAVPALPGKTGPRAEQVSLSPRPAAIERSLDDVLETIVAGRLAPLVEFLPKATVADLRAIMAEDDIGDLSEGMGSFGTAHDLAARRWVELESGAAFSYGHSRSTPLATRMLAHWLELDRKAAADAFLALPKVDRISMGREMVLTDEDQADHLAAIDPAIAWAIEEERSYYPDSKDLLVKARLRIAAALQGQQDAPPVGTEALEIRSAFGLLAQEDRDSALAQAPLIPWPDLRAEVLCMLRPAPASTELPAGAMRTRVVGEEIAALLKTDPERAIQRLQAASPGAERDAMYQVVSEHLAGGDPWRLLETVVAMEGALPSSDAIERSLVFAGKEDPKRAIAMLPELAARFQHFEGIMGFAKDLLSGWIEADGAAAMRWAGEAGIWLNADDMASSNATSEVLLELLSDPNPSLQSMARVALQPHLESAFAAGTATRLLDRIDPEVADRMLNWIAADACGAGRYDDAMKIASLASAEARKEEILPQMGFRALREDRDAAITWLKSLSPDDLSTVAEGIERIVSDPQYGGNDAEPMREALLQLNP